MGWKKILIGAGIGILLWVLLYLLTPFICPAFYTIGPAHPTDQPFCSFLSELAWAWGFILIILGAIIGWIVGRVRNKNSVNPKP